MYMDVLEQEVEALGAEVTRLRLMVHRVSQAMEAPMPPGRHGHVDPMRDTQSSRGVNDSGPDNLQATVDSYKQILPLVQLLLEQQQQHRSRRDASAHRRSRTKASASHRRRHHRSRRSPSSSTTSSSSESSSHSSSQRRADYGRSSRRASKSPDTASSEAPAPQVKAICAEHEDRTNCASEGHPFASAFPTERFSVLSPPSPEAGRHKSLVSIEETPTQAEQRHVPLTKTPKSGSVVDRLRAQRGLAARDDADEASTSTGSSDVMLKIKSKMRNAATSSSTALQQNQRPASVAHGSKAGVSSSRLTPPRPSHSLLSSKLLDAPMPMAPASAMAMRPMDSLRSVSVPAEDMGYYEFSPVVSLLDASQGQLNASVQSQRAAQANQAHHRQSTANSLEYSDQGRYDYSVLGSLANSPAQSHLPEEAAKSAHTASTTAAAAGVEFTPVMRSSINKTNKQLPVQTSMVSRLRELSSSSSSSSSDEDGVAQTPVVLTASTASRPFGASGVVLGARQPISTTTPRSKAASNTFPVLGRTTAALGAGTNLLATLRSMKSSSTSSSSSSDGVAATFHRTQTRQAAKEDHRESSFHNYTEPVASASLGPHFSAHSAQLSAQSFPKPAEVENEASAEFSRAASHSMSRPQTAHSESHAASSVGHRGSLASGGYYYGYEFGMGSPSQQSVVSIGGGAEHGTASSSPAYDY